MDFWLEEGEGGEIPGGFIGVPVGFSYNYTTIRIVIRLLLEADSLAVATLPWKVGITIAAMIPKIVTTIINSTSVKPFFVFIV